MEDNRPITGSIVVMHNLPRGILARVNGQVRWFPDLAAVFRAALTLLDREHQAGRVVSA